MLQTVHLFSLAMAMIAAVWAVVTFRSPKATPDTRRASVSTMLIACAVMIGVTPQTLLPENEWLQTAGPVTSIVLSVITLAVMRRWRSARQAARRPTWETSSTRFSAPTSKTSWSGAGGVSTGPATPPSAWASIPTRCDSA